MASEALHGIRIARVLFELFRWHQPRPGAFGGKRAWSDRIEADVVLSPFDGERSGHRQNTSFRARRWHDETRSAIRGSISRGNAEHVAGLMLRDPFARECLGAMKTSVQHDADNRVEGIRRKFLRTSHKVASGVVDDGVDASKLRVGFIRGGFDRGKVAYIASGVGGSASGLANFLTRLCKRLFPTADHEHFCAE